MERFRRGWRLGMVSLGVLRRDRALGAFPILGALTALFATAAFGIPAAVLFSGDQTVGAVVLAALAIYAATYMTVFFGVALAGTANAVFEGRQASVGEGIGIARGHAGAIAGWAGILASVNIILRAIEERFGFVGTIVAAAIGVAWGLVTFLVIPVIAIEGLGPIAALKRSAGIFRARWGEQVVGTASIVVMVLVFGVLPAALLVGIGFLIGTTVALAATISVAVVIVIVAGVIGQAASGIFAVALSRYVVGEGAAAPFAEEDLAGALSPSAVVPRPGRSSAEGSAEGHDPRAGRLPAPVRIGDHVEADEAVALGADAEDRDLALVGPPSGGRIGRGAGRLPDGEPGLDALVHDPSPQVVLDRRLGCEPAAAAADEDDQDGRQGQPGGASSESPTSAGSG